MQIMEVIRRWQAGESARSIARSSGLARNTVEKYLRLAVAAGVSQGGEPAKRGCALDAGGGWVSARWATFRP